MLVGLLGKYWFVRPGVLENRGLFGLPKSLRTSSFASSMGVRSLRTRSFTNPIGKNSSSEHNLLHSYFSRNVLFNEYFYKALRGSFNSPPTFSP